MRQRPHWNDQISGSHVSYLIYQHLGNLYPKELQDNDLYADIRKADDAPRDVLTAARRR